VTIVQHVAPLVRVLEAIARDHGRPLEPRVSRALARLEGRAGPGATGSRTACAGAPHRRAGSVRTALPRRRPSHRRRPVRPRT
jgi:hypothetical protein